MKLRTARKIVDHRTTCFSWGRREAARRRAARAASRLDTDQLRRIIERPVTDVWNGSPVTVTPRLCGTVFGDGKQLIGLAPIMFRPNRFVVRIDSRWSLEWSDENGPDLWLDDVQDAITDEWYEWPWAEEYGFEWHEDETEDCDSRIRWDDGSSWFKMEWPTKGKGTP